MDITNTIIGIVFFSLIIIPIFIINNNVKKRKNQLLITLNELSSDKNTKFSDTDFWANNSGIGLKGDMLAYFRKADDSQVNEVVDLREVKKCVLVQFDNHGNTPKSNHEINKLALHLTLSNHKEVHLVFFHADAKNFIIGEEFRIAKKWLDIITNKI
ncbi:MAG: hypothetical protein ACK4M1_10695 [Flavobacterium sp.]